MGILRLVLAISVLLSHTGISLLVGGRNSVQIFYVISGYLMSVVLVESKGYASTKNFYANRLLRLYPIYAVVALISLLTYLVQPELAGRRFWETYHEAPPSAVAVLLLSNLTVFFQDWVMFLGVNDGQLGFTTDFRMSQLVLWPGLLIPQAWTLGLELTFYLVAPFVLPNRRLLWSLLFVSLGVRFLLMANGIGMKDPWNNRFFPAELSLFLFGAISHQYVRPFIAKHLLQRLPNLPAVCTVLVILLVAIYSEIPIREPMKSVLLVGIFPFLMPLLFEFQSNNAVDRAVGEYSYPLYMCHYFVIKLSMALMGTYAVTDELALSAVSLVASLLFSHLLLKLVADPVEKIRRRFRTER